MDKPEGGRSVKSAERVLDLLETIGRQPDGASFAGLGRDLGIPKSSLHALLEVLLGRGYIDLDAATRRYSLGIRVWETGQAYQRHHNLLSEAIPVLSAIVARVNETAQLAKLSGRENVYLAKVDSTHALRLQSEVGSRLPAHATGVGKALLAQLPDEEVIARCGRGELPVYTPSTYPTVEALLAELAAVRKRGFAIDNEEYTPGVFCLAVPVFDSGEPASTALSVSVPTQRATVAALGAILAEIADASLQIAQRCGAKRRNARLAALGEPSAAAAEIAALAASGRYALATA